MHLRMGHVATTETDVKPSVEGQSVGFMRSDPVEGDSSGGLGALVAQGPFYKKGEGQILTVSLGEGPSHLWAVLGAS